MTIKCSVANNNYNIYYNYEMCFCNPSNGKDICPLRVYKCHYVYKQINIFDWFRNKADILRLPNGMTSKCAIFQLSVDVNGCEFDSSARELIDILD